MRTLYQQLKAHLETHGCAFSHNSTSSDKMEVWKLPDGESFLIPKYFGAKSNIHYITDTLEIPPLSYEQH